MTLSNLLVFCLLILWAVSVWFILRHWHRKLEKNQEEFRRLHQETSEAETRIDEAYQRETSEMEGDEAGAGQASWD